MLLPLLFVACTQNEPYSNKSNAIPSWYLNPIQNSAQYLYGIGEGKTLQEAKNNALNDMASRLSVTINSSVSQYKQSVSYNNSLGSYQKNITENVNVEVKAIKFTNATIEQSHSLANSIFVLMKVSKQELFNAYKTEFDLSENTINSTLLANKTKPFLEQISTLQTLNETIEKARSQALILNSINTAFDSNSYLMNYNTIQNNATTLKDKVRIKLSTNESQKLFANEFIDVLNQEGYKIVSSQPNTEIQLISTLNNSMALGWYIIKATTTISVISDGRIVSNHTISSVGRSSSSQENALVNASKTFKLEVQKKGLNSILFNQ
jgi:hypothetical protein